MRVKRGRVKERAHFSLVIHLRSLIMIVFLFFFVLPTDSVDWLALLWICSVFSWDAHSPTSWCDRAVYKRVICEKRIEREHFTFSLCGFMCAVASICFSISTTTVMISAAISLICENSHAVLTTAKPLPAFIPIQFYRRVYGTVPCCDQAQPTYLKPETDDIP